MTYFVYYFLWLETVSMTRVVNKVTGADPGFQVRGGGAHLKKLRRVEGGAKCFGVFRVKNHDFTPKNHIFPNFRGGGGAPGAPPPPPGSAPGSDLHNQSAVYVKQEFSVCSLTL